MGSGHLSGSRQPPQTDPFRPEGPVGRHGNKTLLGKLAASSCLAERQAALVRQMRVIADDCLLELGFGPLIRL